MQYFQNYFFPGTTHKVEEQLYKCSVGLILKWASINLLNYTWFQLLWFWRSSFAGPPSILRDWCLCLSLFMVHGLLPSPELNTSSSWSQVTPYETFRLPWLSLSNTYLNAKPVKLYLNKQRSMKFHSPSTPLWENNWGDPTYFAL